MGVDLVNLSRAEFEPAQVDVSHYTGFHISVPEGGFEPSSVPDSSLSAVSVNSDVSSLLIESGVEPFSSSGNYVSAPEVGSDIKLGNLVLSSVSTMAAGDPIDSSVSHLLHIHKEVFRSGVPNFKGVRIPIYTKVNVAFFEKYAAGFGDKRLVDFLKFGFPVGNISLPKPQAFTRNHSSARLFDAQITKFVESGLKDNSIAGPLQASAFEHHPHFSPLGSVEKKDTTERRIIMDLSFPSGNSINDFIPDKEYVGEISDLHFPSIDNLISLVCVEGPGCLLFKRDLRKAYRQLLFVDPGDLFLLGFKWKGHSYFDRTLPMGIKPAAGACQSVTDFIRHVFQIRLVALKIVNYIDDLAGAAKLDAAWKAYYELGNILMEAGIEESPSKASPPDVKMVFLGIEFCTVSMTVRVDESRLVEILALLVTWIRKSAASRKEIQSLLGKLSFISAVVRASRIFLARMFEFLRGLPKTGRICLSEGFKKDVLWWHRFMPLFNGVSMIANRDWSSPDSVFATDACLLSFGGYMESEKSYFYGYFPKKFLDNPKVWHISCLELLTVVVAVKLWFRSLANLRILIRCDNKPACDVINSGRARDPMLQSCVRELVFLCAQGRFQIRALHIQGKVNRGPDWLSRFHEPGDNVNKFLNMVGANFSRRQVDDSMFEFAHDW